MIQLLSKPIITLLCCVLWGAPVHAQSLPTSRGEGLQMPPRLVEGQRKLAKKVVLVGMQGRFAGESWPEAEGRAEAELRALGFEVVRVEARAQQLEARIAELGARAATERALGSVRIVRQGKQRLAQIWLHDALTGKMLLRTIEIGAPGSADAGMRVVELIYASLLETQLRAKGRTPPSVQKLVRERLARVRQRPVADAQSRRVRWAIALAPALHLNPGESGAALGLGVGLQRWLMPRLALGLALFAPLSAATVEAPQGAADLQLTSALIEAEVIPWPVARLSPSVALGAGALLLRSSGRALAPHLSEVDWAAAFATSLELRLALRLVRGLWLRFAGGATLALPNLGVRLADERVAVLGRPLVHFSLGLQWRWTR